jgi:hypothetical protein
VFDCSFDCRCDVCIIGAGLAGLQCAADLATNHPEQQQQMKNFVSRQRREGKEDETPFLSGSCQHIPLFFLLQHAPPDHHPLSIIVVEGRNRIGGRVATTTLRETVNGVPAQTVVEAGAAFIHGVDKKHNEAYRLALKYDWRRTVKNDVRTTDMELLRRCATVFAS